MTISGESFLIALPTLEISSELDGSTMDICSSNSNYFNQGVDRQTECCDCDKC